MSWMKNPNTGVPLPPPMGGSGGPPPPLLSSDSSILNQHPTPPQQVPSGEFYQKQHQSIPQPVPPIQNDWNSWQQQQQQPHQQQPHQHQNHSQPLNYQQTNYNNQNIYKNQQFQPITPNQNSINSQILPPPPLPSLPLPPLTVQQQHPQQIRNTPSNTFAQPTAQNQSIMSAEQFQAANMFNQNNTSTTSDGWGEWDWNDNNNSGGNNNKQPPIQQNQQQQQQQQQQLFTSPPSVVETTADPNLNINQQNFQNLPPQHQQQYQNQQQPHFQNIQPTPPQQQPQVSMYQQSPPQLQQQQQQQPTPPQQYPGQSFLNNPTVAAPNISDSFTAENNNWNWNQSNTNIPLQQQQQQPLQPPPPQPLLPPSEITSPLLDNAPALFQTVGQIASLKHSRNASNASNSEFIVGTTNSLENNNNNNNNTIESRQPDDLKNTLQQTLSLLPPPPVAPAAAVSSLSSSSSLVNPSLTRVLKHERQLTPQWSIESQMSHTSSDRSIESDALDSRSTNTSEEHYTHHAQQQYSGIGVLGGGGISDQHMNYGEDNDFSNYNFQGNVEISGNLQQQQQQQQQQLHQPPTNEQTDQLDEALQSLNINNHHNQVYSPPTTHDSQQQSTLSLPGHGSFLPPPPPVSVSPHQQQQQQQQPLPPPPVSTTPLSLPPSSISPGIHQAPSPLPTATTSLPPPPSSSTTSLPPPPSTTSSSTASVNPFKRITASNQTNQIKTASTLFTTQQQQPPLPASSTAQSIFFQPPLLPPDNSEVPVPDSIDSSSLLSSFNTNNTNSTVDNNELAPHNDRNQYLQTGHLSEDGYTSSYQQQQQQQQQQQHHQQHQHPQQSHIANISSPENNEIFPPPGLSRLVLGEPEQQQQQQLHQQPHRNPPPPSVGLSFEEPPPGLDRMIPGGADNNNFERQADGQDTFTAVNALRSNQQQQQQQYVPLPPPPQQEITTNFNTTDRNLYLVPGDESDPQVQPTQQPTHSQQHYHHQQHQQQQQNQQQHHHQQQQQQQHQQNQQQHQQRVVTGGLEQQQLPTTQNSSPRLSQQRELIMDGENLEDEQRRDRNEPIEGANFDDQITSINLPEHEINIESTVGLVNATTAAGTSTKKYNNSNPSTGNDDSDNNNNKDRASYYNHRSSVRRTEETTTTSSRRRRGPGGASGSSGNKNPAERRDDTEDTDGYSGDRDKERSRFNRDGGREGSVRRDPRDSRERDVPTGGRDKRNDRRGGTGGAGGGDREKYRSDDRTVERKRGGERSEKYERGSDRYSRYETDGSRYETEDSRYDRHNRGRRGGGAGGGGTATGSTDNRGEDIDKKYRRAGGERRKDERNRENERDNDRRRPSDKYASSRSGGGGADPRYYDYEEYNRSGSRNAIDRSAGVADRSAAAAQAYYQQQQQQQQSQFGYVDQYTYYQQQQYYENMRRNNPQEYAKFYKDYYRKMQLQQQQQQQQQQQHQQLQGAGLDVSGAIDATGRDSVHSGRSSVNNNNEKERYGLRPSSAHHHQQQYYDTSIVSNNGGIYQRQTSFSQQHNSTMLDTSYGGVGGVGATPEMLFQQQQIGYHHLNQQQLQQQQQLSSARSNYSNNDYSELRNTNYTGLSTTTTANIDEPQRLTPCKFIESHCKASLSAGFMVYIKPQFSHSSELSNVVKIMNIGNFVAGVNDSTRKLLQMYPGPLRRGTTHKKTIIEFCEEQIRLGPMSTSSSSSMNNKSHGNSMSSIYSLSAAQGNGGAQQHYRSSYTLMWNLLILLLRQNGMVVGADISELLLKNKSEYPYENSATAITTTITTIGGGGGANNNSSQTTSRRNSIDSDGNIKSPGQLDALDRIGNAGDDTHSSSSNSGVSGGATTTSKQLTENEITDKFRNYLLYGSVNEALEFATDNNLWGHALFLASKMDRRSHANVLMKFANKLSLNDPLQTLYQLMSGRTPNSVTSIQDEKWGDWRPHLAMILANNSPKPELDRKAIMTLGDSLYNRGDLLAAQFCYIMAQVEFGQFANVNPDTTFMSNSASAIRLILLGGSHYRTTFREFATNEAIIMTEIYEFACTLNDQQFSIVDFQPYKYLLATRLLDYGMNFKSLMYLEQVSVHIHKNPTKYTGEFIEKVYRLADQLKYFDPVFERMGDVTQDDGNDDGGGVGLTGGDIGKSIEDQPWLKELLATANEKMENRLTTTTTIASATYGLVENNEGYINDDQQQTNYQQTNYQQQKQNIDQEFAQINQQFSELNMQYNNTITTTTIPSLDTANNQYHHQQNVMEIPPYAGATNLYAPVQQEQPQQQQTFGYNENIGYDNQQQQQQQQQSNNAYPDQHSYDYWNQQQQQQQQQPPEEEIPKPSISMPNSMSNKPGFYDDTPSSNQSQQQQQQQHQKQANQKSSSDPDGIGGGGNDSLKNASLGGVKNSNQSSNNSGWFGGIWNKLSLKPKNQMILPDDKNPTIVWDADKKKWVNTDGDSAESEQFKPPPKMSDLSQSMAMNNGSNVVGGFNLGPSSLLAGSTLPPPSFDHNHHQNSSAPSSFMMPPVATPAAAATAAPSLPTPINNDFSLNNISGAPSNIGNVATVGAAVINNPSATNADPTVPNKVPNLQSNMFKMQRNRTLKKSYVDVFNPSGAPTKPIETVMMAPSVPAAAPQSGFFIPGAVPEQQSQQENQFYNPNQFNSAGVVGNNGGSGYPQQ